jgi:type VI secretion system protein ImpF
MSASDQDVIVTLSLLDRLIDAEPESSKEGQLGSWEQRRQFRNSLCRDLTALLNTRRAERDFDPVYEQATASLLSFGIIDFTAYNLKAQIDQDCVRRSIERSIRQFEPRLTGVTVSVEHFDPLRPVVRFQVSAMLRAEPAADALLFDVTLHRESRRIAVSGASS